MYLEISNLLLFVLLSPQKLKLFDKLNGQKSYRCELNKWTWIVYIAYILRFKWIYSAAMSVGNIFLGISATYTTIVFAFSKSYNSVFVVLIYLVLRSGDKIPKTFKDCPCFSPTEVVRKIRQKKAKIRYISLLTSNWTFEDWIPIRFGFATRTSVAPARRFLLQGS